MARKKPTKKSRKPAARAAAKSAAQKKSPARKVAAAKPTARRKLKSKGRAPAPVKRARPKQRIAISHHRDEDFKADGLTKKTPRPQIRPLGNEQLDGRRRDRSIRIGCGARRDSRSRVDSRGCRETVICNADHHAAAATRRARFGACKSTCRAAVGEVTPSPLSAEAGSAGDGGARSRVPVRRGRRKAASSSKRAAKPKASESSKRDRIFIGIFRRALSLRRL